MTATAMSAEASDPFVAWRPADSDLMNASARSTEELRPRWDSNRVETARNYTRMRRSPSAIGVLE
jgi:hypothetical protein